MMRTSLLAVLLLSLSGSLAAQSLGEVAEQEKAKKKKKDPAAKTYSDKDLKKASPDPKASPSPGESRPESGSETSEGAQSVRGDENYWRSGAEDRRNTIKKIEQTLAEIQAKIANLRGPMSPPQPGDAISPDPYHLFTEDPQRKALESELAKVKGDLALAKKALEDFEEDARRKSIPPGWLREP